MKIGPQIFLYMSIVQNIFFPSINMKGQGKDKITNVEILVFVNSDTEWHGTTHLEIFCSYVAVMLKDYFYSKLFKLKVNV